jgi:hypothetical protein
VDLKGVKESKNYVDHTNYITVRPPPITHDVDLFWKLMRSGRADESSLNQITNPNVDPTAVQPDDTAWWPREAYNPHYQLLHTLISSFLQPGKN